MDENFIQEAEEELRRERLMKLWQKWGNWVIGGLLAGVLGITGYSWWDQQRAARRDAATAELLKAHYAIGNQAIDRAIDLLKSADMSSAAGLKPVADLSRLSQQLRDSSKRAATLQELKDLANDKNVDIVWRDLAELVLIAFDSEKPNATRGDIQSRLEVLAAPNRPMRYSAQELLAYLFVNVGEFDQARQRLQMLEQDPKTPSAMRNRVRLFLQSPALAGTLDHAPRS